jgi:hypothetical protein
MVHIYLALLFGGFGGVTLLAIIGAAHGGGHHGASHAASHHVLGHSAGHHVVGHGSEHGPLDHAGEHHQADYISLHPHLHAPDERESSQSHSPDHLGSNASLAPNSAGANKPDEIDEYEEKKQNPVLSAVLYLVSPLTVFSFAMGMGASGILLNDFAPHTLIASPVVAALGGGVFQRFVIQPIWNVLLNFASKPSTALEGSLASEAEALTKFDEKGRGIVHVSVDGQFARVLAELDPRDRPFAAEIKPGDKLFVTEIDGKTNRCKVSRY